MSPIISFLESNIFGTLTGCSIILAVACLIVSEVIMNSKKKHYPEGAKIRRQGNILFHNEALRTGLRFLIRNLLLYDHILASFRPFSCCRQDVENKDHLCILQSICLDPPRNASYAPAPSGLFRTLLSVRYHNGKYPDRTFQLQIHSFDHRFLFKLCSILCRDLQRRYPVNA